MNDTVIVDIELRRKWAVDEVAEAVSGLMDRLETIKDAQTVERVAVLFKAINNYIKVVGDV